MQQPLESKDEQKDCKTKSLVSCDFSSSQNEAFLIKREILLGKEGGNMFCLLSVKSKEKKYIQTPTFYGLQTKNPIYRRPWALATFVTFLSCTWNWKMNSFKLIKWTFHVVMNETILPVLFARVNGPVVACKRGLQWILTCWWDWSPVNLSIGMY